MLLMIVKNQASPVRIADDKNLYSHEQHMLSLLRGRSHSHTRDNQTAISNDNISMIRSRTSNTLYQ